MEHAEHAEHAEFAEYRRQWSRLHGELEPSGLVVRWLRFVHPLAAGVARAGLGPDALTLAALTTAVAVTVPAVLGGRWALLAAALVAVSAVLDALDGAVAVLTGRVTRRGAVLDATCDRVAEAAFGAALWLLGAPPPVAVAAVAVGWLHEYLRARASAAGMSGVGRITVAERPTRVIVAAMFLFGAGLFPAAAPGWVAAGALVWSLSGMVGLAQLVLAVYRALA